MWFAIGLIVGLLVGVWAGWIFRGVHVMLRISQNPEGMRQLIKEIEELDANIRTEVLARRAADIEGGAQPTQGTERLEAVAEQQGSLWYLFAKDTDQFLGQGATIEEALAQAQSRWPTKTIWHNAHGQANHTA